MGIGVSLFLMAVGAILAFAVSTTVSGVDLVTVGVILMAVGVLGLVITLVMFGPRRRTSVTQEQVYDDGPAYPDRSRSY